MRPTAVAVCIATYRRPAGLARLLDALAQLELDRQMASVRIVVVDNDATGSSSDVCHKQMTGSPWPIDYLIEPRQGIPFARNAAVSACYESCDAIAFIDDDELPDAAWLAHLLAARESYSADVVTGPVLPRFEHTPPRWASEGPFFSLPRYASGSIRDRGFTNNVLVDSRVFRSLPTWFDERLRFTGGSDTHFFRRAHLAGFRIVWCDEAVVHDDIPASRINLRWVTQRAYRYGHTHAFVRYDLAQDTRSRLVLSAILRLREAATSAVVGVVARKGWRLLEAVTETAYAAGMLANVLGSNYDEYRARRTDS